MENISPELLVLYDAYVAAQRRGIPLAASHPLVRIVDDRVIGDAVAGSVAALEKDLRSPRCPSRNTSLTVEQLI